MNLLRGSVIALGGVVGAGLLAWPTMAADDSDPDGYKRDDQDTGLVTVVDDDDDDDGRDNTRDNTRDDATRNDVTRNDNTRDDVTRNDDVSRDQQTRDSRNDSRDD